MEASNGLLSNSGKTVTISMRIILYLNLFHQLAILALVEGEGTMFFNGSLFRD
jgi:hypothetical protein